MPHEELTPRSDSISTESSASPPDPPGSNHSETSSGVHSNASSEHPNPPPRETNQTSPPTNQDSSDTNLNRRATSVADLVQPREDQWKSFSLQRNVQPPNYPNQNFYNPHHTKNHSVGGYNVSNQNPLYGYTKNTSLINVSSPNGVPNTSSPQPVYGYTKNSFGYTQNATPVYSSQNVQNGTVHVSYGYTSGSQTQTSVPQPVYGFTSNNNTQYSQKIQTSNPQIVSTQNVQYTSSQNVQYNSSTQNYAQNSSPQHSQNYGYTQNPTSSPQHVAGYVSSPQNTQGLYGYTSSPQNNQPQQSGYGYTSSPQNTQVNPTGSQYGYTSNPQNTSVTQTQNPQSLYGYTSSPQNSQAQTSVPQPLYGYTSSPQTSVSHVSSPQTNQYTQNQPIYGFTSNSSSTGSTFSVEKAGGIPVILENSESTVVIRRKNAKSVVCENSQTPVIKEEPFGRSTNMRMTSFTEQLPPDLKNIQSSSATLPHYPTQPNQNPTQQYSTMPLPLQQKSNQSVNLGAGTSCNVYSRQHSTIPTHHNGVRLFPANQNPYVKRYQNGVRVNGEGIYGTRKEENYFSS